jgi:hypothetical protein
VRLSYLKVVLLLKARRKGVMNPVMQAASTVNTHQYLQSNKDTNV